MSRSSAVKSIVNARSMWIDSLHAKNLNGILDCYDRENTLFKGTINRKVTTSRLELEIYFRNFLNRNPTVTFIKSDIIYMNYSFFDSGTYTFQFKNSKPIYANYQFVYKMIGDEPKIISHFSSEF